MFDLCDSEGYKCDDDCERNGPHHLFPVSFNAPNFGGARTVFCAVAQHLYDLVRELLVQWYFRNPVEQQVGDFVRLSTLVALRFQLAQIQLAEVARPESDLAGGSTSSICRIPIWISRSRSRCGTVEAEASL